MKSLNAVKSKYSSMLESNLKKTARKRRYPDDFKEEIIQLYNQGIKLSEIAKTFGISLSGFYQWKKDSKKNDFSVIDKRLKGKAQSFFKEVQISQSSEVFTDKNKFLLETPKGFKVMVHSQQVLVSIIRDLEKAY